MFGYIYILSILCLSPGVWTINPKLCKNCLHFIPADTVRYSKCSFFTKVTDNSIDKLISGISSEPETDYTYCYIARGNDKMCGEKATSYVRRTKKNKK